MARVSNPNPFFLGYFVNEAAINSAYSTSFVGAYVFNAGTATTWTWNGSAWVDTTNGIYGPGGSDTQVQFNDGGQFAGDAGMTWNKTTNALTITGNFSSPNTTSVSSGSGAPGTTPNRKGNIYIDNDGPDIYISTGTASSADWTLIFATP